MTYSYQARATREGIMALKPQQSISKEKLQNHFSHKQLTVACETNDIFVSLQPVNFGQSWIVFSFFPSTVVHSPSLKQKLATTMG